LVIWCFGLRTPSSVHSRHHASIEGLVSNRFVRGRPFNCSRLFLVLRWCSFVTAVWQAGWAGEYFAAQNELRSPAA